MHHSLKFAYSLSLLVALVAVGCNSDATEEPATAPEPAPAPVAEPAPAPAPAPESADADAESTSENKAENPRKSRANDLKAMFAPDRIGPQLEGGLAMLKENVASITDVESAELALGKLRSFYAQMQMMSAMSAMIPPESKPIVAEKLAAGMGPVHEAVDKLYENEEIKAKLDPTLAPVLKMLDGLTARFNKPAEEPAEGETDADADGEAEGESDSDAEGESAPEADSAE